MPYTASELQERDINASPPREAEPYYVFFIVYYYSLKNMDLTSSTSGIVLFYNASAIGNGKTLLPSKLVPRGVGR